jgi:F-type H+-transporting ATPase subunit b
MNKSITCAAIFVGASFPQIVGAAESAPEESGSWLLLFFFVVNFALFMFVLIYFAAPIARKFFSDRSTAIREGLAHAQSALSEAQDMANRAAAKMATLDAELKELITEIEEETKFQVGKIREIAKTTADRIHRDTELSTAALSDAAQRRVRARLAETATQLARDLIKTHIQSSDQSRLIDRFMDKLGEGAPR